MNIRTINTIAIAVMTAFLMTACGGSGSSDKKKSGEFPIEVEKTESGDSSSSSSTSSNSNSGSEDWDAVLKSYETYIDQYIKLMKKAKDGDASAMTEYVEMMENATDLAEKMENAGDDLSTAQMNKFMELQTKMANAAMEMY